MFRNLARGRSRGAAVMDDDVCVLVLVGGVGPTKACVSVASCSCGPTGGCTDCEMPLFLTEPGLAAGSGLNT